MPLPEGFRLCFPEEDCFAWEDGRYPYYAARPFAGRRDLAVAAWITNEAPEEWRVMLVRLQSQDSTDNLHHGAMVRADSLEFRDLGSALEVQCYILHLIQTHLPREVTDNAA